MSESAAVLRMEALSVWLEDGARILDGIDWTVAPGEHWALLGPNGSGKSTLLAMAGAHRFPSEGSVSVLGLRLGETSLWDLRERIGQVDPGAKTLDWLTVEEIVLTGLTNTVWPQPGRATPRDEEHARDLLALVGASGLRDREFPTLSQGERQRVRIARALMAEPPLLLLDEPATGLDLPAREALMRALASLAVAQPSLATILVSHHLEELPASTTHAMLLREGKIVAAGPVDDVLTPALVSRAFGFPIEVERQHGRWAARADASWQVGSP